MIDVCRLVYTRAPLQAGAVAIWLAVIANCHFLFDDFARGQEKGSSATKLRYAESMAPMKSDEPETFLAKCLSAYFPDDRSVTEGRPRGSGSDWVTCSPDALTNDETSEVILKNHGDFPIEFKVCLYGHRKALAIVSRGFLTENESRLIMLNNDQLRCVESIRILWSVCYELGQIHEDWAYELPGRSPIAGQFSKSIHVFPRRGRGQK